jgi:hypothetical protein
MKVEIDNDELKWQGNEWYQGFGTQIENPIKGRSTASVTIPSLGLPQIVPVQTTLSNVGMSNWLSSKCKITETGSTVTNKLKDLSQHNVLLHWLKIKGNCDLDNGFKKIKITVGAKKTPPKLDCNYEPDKQEIVVSVSNNYMKSAPVGILGGILFESHNARNGVHFRTIDTNRDSKKTPGFARLNSLEYAYKKVCIEADTNVECNKQYLEILRSGGYIGPQEWRNLVSMVKKLGFTNTPWTLTGDNVLNFALTPHNPNIVGLANYTLCTYIKTRPYKLHPYIFQADLDYVYRAVYKQFGSTWRQNMAWTLVRSANTYPNETLALLQRLYAMIIANPQATDQNFYNWLQRWRLPTGAYDRLVGTPPNLAGNFKATVTRTNNDWLTAYNV